MGVVGSDAIRSRQPGKGEAIRHGIPHQRTVVTREFTRGPRALLEHRQGAGSTRIQDLESLGQSNMCETVEAQSEPEILLLFEHTLYQRQVL